MVNAERVNADAMDGSLADQPLRSALKPGKCNPESSPRKAGEPIKSSQPEYIMTKAPSGISISQPLRSSTVTIVSASSSARADDDRRTQQEFYRISVRRPSAPREIHVGAGMLGKYPMNVVSIVFDADQRFALRLR